MFILIYYSYNFKKIMKMEKTTIEHRFKTLIENNI